MAGLLNVRTYEIGMGSEGAVLAWTGSDFVEEGETAVMPNGNIHSLVNKQDDVRLIVMETSNWHSEADTTRYELEIIS